MLGFLHSFASLRHSRNLKKKTTKKTNPQRAFIFPLFEVCLTFRTNLTDCLLFHGKSHCSYKIKWKQLKAKGAFCLSLKTSGVLGGKIIFFLYRQSGWINPQINVKYNRNFPILPSFFPAVASEQQNRNRAAQTEAKCAHAGRKPDEHFNTRPGLGARY